MSGGLDILSLKSDDMLKFLAVNAHTGSENMDYQMEQYIFKRTPSGTHIINLRKTWEKLLLAARAIVSITNPADVFVISSYVKCQRAILKFASHTGATPIAGRFTPGTFTNQIQKNFKEPLLLIVADPLVDHQPIMEAACVNIPVIAFCNAESPLRYVDIAIPCNNKGVHCIGLMFWMLAREILRFRGTIPREKAWEVMPDLYFYREPEETEKEGALEGEKAITEDPNAMGKVSDPGLLQTQWASSAGGFGDMGLGQPAMPHSPIKHQDMDQWGQDAPIPTAPHYAAQPNIIPPGMGSYGMPMGVSGMPSMAPPQSHIPPAMGRPMGGGNWDSMQQAAPAPVAAPVANKDWEPAVAEWGADSNWN